MSNPDVEHAGDAIGRPGSSLERRRNPLLLLLALSLFAGGLVAGVLGLVRLIDEAGPQDDRTLARGTVAALGERPEIAIFDHAGPITVWIEVSGNEEVSDTEVAGTSCRFDSENATTDVQGNVQTSSLEIGKWATIGEAEVNGRTVVSCGRVEWGRRANRDRLEESTAYLIEAGTPGDGLRGLWLLLPGIAAVLAAIPLFFVWKSGSARPR